MGDRTPRRTRHTTTELPKTKVIGFFGKAPAAGYISNSSPPSASSATSDASSNVKGSKPTTIYKVKPLTQSPTSEEVASPSAPENQEIVRKSSSRKLLSNIGRVSLGTPTASPVLTQSPSTPSVVHMDETQETSHTPRGKRSALSKTHRVISKPHEEENGHMEDVEPLLPAKRASAKHPTAKKPRKNVEPVRMGADEDEQLPTATANDEPTVEDRMEGVVAAETVEQDLGERKTDAKRSRGSIGSHGKTTAIKRSAAASIASLEEANAKAKRTEKKGAPIRKVSKSKPVEEPAVVVEKENVEDGDEEQETEVPTSKPSRKRQKVVEDQTPADTQAPSAPTLPSPVKQNILQTPQLNSPLPGRRSFWGGLTSQVLNFPSSVKSLASNITFRSANNSNTEATHPEPSAEGQKMQNVESQASESLPSPISHLPSSTQHSPLSGESLSPNSRIQFGYQQPRSLQDAQESFSQPPRSPWTSQDPNYPVYTPSSPYTTQSYRPPPLSTTSTPGSQRPPLSPTPTRSIHPTGSPMYSPLSPLYNGPRESWITSQQRTGSLVAPKIIYHPKPGPQYDIVGAKRSFGSTYDEQQQKSKKLSETMLAKVKRAIWRLFWWLLLVVSLSLVAYFVFGTALSDFIAGSPEKRLRHCEDALLNALRERAGQHECDETVPPGFGRIELGAHYQNVCPYAKDIPLEIVKKALLARPLKDVESSPGGIDEVGGLYYKGDAPLKPLLCALRDGIIEWMKTHLTILAGIGGLLIFAIFVLNRYRRTQSTKRLAHKIANDIFEKLKAEYQKEGKNGFIRKDYEEHDRCDKDKDAARAWPLAVDIIESNIHVRTVPRSLHGDQVVTWAWSQ